jgi:hypothetical protein
MAVLVSIAVRVSAAGALGFEIGGGHRGLAIA